MNEIGSALYLRWLVVIGILRWKFVRYPATFFLVITVYLSGISLGTHIHSNEPWSESAQKITGIVTGSELKRETILRSGKSRLVHYCYPIIQYSFGEKVIEETLLWLKFNATSEAGEDCAREMYGNAVSFWIVETEVLTRTMEHKPTESDQRNSLATNIVFFPLGLFLLWQMWKRPKKTNPSPE